MKFLDKKLHGDVIIKLTDLEKVDGTPAKTKVIQESSHPHYFEGDAELVENSSGKFLKVNSSAVIKHQATEHKHEDMTLQKGIYKISQAQEFNPFTGLVAPVVD